MEGPGEVQEGDVGGWVTSGTRRLDRRGLKERSGSGPVSCSGYLIRDGWERGTSVKGREVPLERFYVKTQ